MRTRRVVLLVVVVTVAWATLTFFRMSRVERGFNALQGNESKEEVLRLMGKPWKDEACGEYLGGGSPQCVEEFIYGHPFAPYVPEYWIIEFDRSSHVISHLYTTSP